MAPKTRPDYGCKHLLFLRPRQPCPLVPPLSPPITANVPKLTAVLSQYELLLTICANLSSADIAHLSATCEEHRAYITPSEPLLKEYMASACCDGKGVIARAKAFGHWNGDVAEAAKYCSGADAKASADCGAMACCFHVFYSTRGFRQWDDVSEHEEDNDYTSDVYWEADDEACDCDVWERNEVVSDKDPVELTKVSFIYHDMRKQHHCGDCQPLLFPDDNDSDRCACNVYDHFVLPWRCISCIFVEEAAAAHSQAKAIVTYIDRDILDDPKVIKPGVLHCTLKVS